MQKRALWISRAEKRWTVVDGGGGRLTRNEEERNKKKEALSRLL